MNFQNTKIKDLTRKIDLEAQEKKFKLDKELKDMFKARQELEGEMRGLEN